MCALCVHVLRGVLWLSCCIRFRARVRVLFKVCVVRVVYGVMSCVFVVVLLCFGWLLFCVRVRVCLFEFVCVVVCALSCDVVMCCRCCVVVGQCVCVACLWFRVCCCLVCVIFSFLYISCVWCVCVLFSFDVFVCCACDVLCDGSWCVFVSFVFAWVFCLM